MIILFISLFVSLNLNPVTTDSILVNSKIESVTVFRQHAQVHRQGNVKLQPGRNLIVFKKLSGSLYPQTIQLHSNAPLTVFSINHKFDYSSDAKNSQRLQYLKQQRDSLKMETSFLQSDAEVINHELMLLSRTENIITNNEITTSELTQLLDLYRKRASKLEREKLTINKKIQSKQQIINKLTAQIRNLGGGLQNQYAEVIAEVNYESSQSQTSFSYSIQTPYSIPSDGQEYTVNFRTEELPANYTYKTIPRANERTYLTAKIPHWSEFDFLPGRASIYFDNGYEGSTSINSRTTSDSLQISLGLDEEIIVERKEIQ
jgi:hypothetical protein